jgi:type I restriction enzyme, S subunit
MMPRLPLPSGWELVRLADLGNEIKSATRPKAGTEYELYSVPAFVEGVPERVDGSVIGSTKRLVSPDDLLLCKINPRINRVWFVGPANGAQQIASNEYLVLRLRDRDRSLLQWLVWYLQSPSFRNWIELNVEGATGSHTRAKSPVILEQLVPIAPRLDRERIVAELDRQITRLDAGVSSIATAGRRLADMRRSVLLAATRGRLGTGLRSGWRSLALDDVADPARPICYGILKPRTSGAGTVPYVEVRDLRQAVLRADQLNRTTEELDRQYSRSRLRAGDVLVAIRGSYERIGIVPPDLEGANISRDVARISPRDGVDPHYLLLWLQAPITQSYFKSVARGVAVKGVNIGDLRKTRVDLPAIEEQRTIVQEAGRQLSVVEELLAELKTTSDRARALRRDILAAAFAGRLDQAIGTAHV